MANLTKADCTAVAARVSELVAGPIMTATAGLLADLEHEIVALTTGMSSELRAAKFPLTAEQFAQLLKAMDDLLAHVERLQERVAAIERRAGD